MQPLVKLKSTFWCFVYLFGICAMIPSFAAAQDFPAGKDLKADLVWAATDGICCQIYQSHYENGAWSGKVALTKNDLLNTTPAIDTGPDGVAWAVWSTVYDAGAELYYSFFKDNQWSVPSKIPTPFSSNTAPSIMINADNTPWLVWAGFDGEDDDIFFSRWNGRAWGAPVRISTDDTDPDTLPVIWKSDDGIIRVKWSGFGSGARSDVIVQWSETGWSEEMADTEQLYRAYLDNVSGMVPALPESVTQPRLASISLRVNGKNRSYRVYDIFKGVEKKMVAPLTSQSGQTAAGEDILIGFGDSITQGTPYIHTKGDGRRVGGYEPDLETLTRGIDWPTQVLNYGIGGETSREGYYRLGGVLRHYHSRYVLLLEGTNDSIYGISPYSTIQYLSGMIGISRSYHALPILATLLPDTKQNYGKDIPGDYNPQIIHLAHTKNIPLSDQYAAVIGNWSALTYDGRHPNTAGYQVMAETWLKSLPRAAVLTLDASGSRVRSARLNGRVNPQGVPTAAYFEYGLNAECGSRTETVNVGTGVTDVFPSAVINKLKRDTAYYFRVVASNIYGTVRAQTLSFRTVKGSTSAFLLLLLDD